MSTSSDQPVSQTTQPQLGELFGKYLERQAHAHRHGLGLADMAAEGQVTPYDATAVQPVEPRHAWDGARAAVHYFSRSKDASTWAVPPEWPQLVTRQALHSALPFCLGNYPQMVRDFAGLMRQPLVAPSDTPSPPQTLPGLVSWAQTCSWAGRKPNPLLAAAVLRLAGHQDLARELLTDHKKDMPAVWEAAWANESAALAWHSGHLDEAAAKWRKQPDSAPVHFNRGLAELVAGKRHPALEWFAKAVAIVPEGDAWHHLGKLYMAMAELQGK